MVDATKIWLHRAYTVYSLRVGMEVKEHGHWQQPQRAATRADNKEARSSFRLRRFTVVLLYGLLLLYTCSPDHKVRIDIDVETRDSSAPATTSHLASPPTPMRLYILFNIQNIHHHIHRALMYFCCGMTMISAAAAGSASYK